jgi:phosphate:Na+ symporter
MRNAVLVAEELDALRGAPPRSAPSEAPDGEQEVAADSMAGLESCAKALHELQPAHRMATLGSVAGGTISADQAFARVDTVRRLERIARHARRCAAHLVG